jgi:hypothetical protein
MATTVKKIAEQGRVFAGGKLLLTVEVEFGTEYPAKGLVVKASELSMKSIDAVIPISEILLAAEGTEAWPPSIVFVGPEASQFKIQIFGSGAAKKEAQFELADKNGAASEGKVTLFVVGTST